MLHEYKFVPAPARGEKRRGVKAPEARFAATLEDTVNTLAAEGWEYLRSDTLPSEERSGLRQVTTQWRTMLVFRRALLTQPQAPASGTDRTLRAVPAETPPSGLPRFAARREDRTIAEPVRKLFATRDGTAGKPAETPDATPDDDEGDDDNLFRTQDDRARRDLPDDDR